MRPLWHLLWSDFRRPALTALEDVLAGVLCCLTIVGFRLGVQCFKIAGAALFPFGKALTNTGAAGHQASSSHLVARCSAGIWIFLSHLALAVPIAGRSSAFVRVSDVEAGDASARAFGRRRAREARLI